MSSMAGCIVQYEAHNYYLLRYLRSKKERMTDVAIV